MKDNTSKEIGKLGDRQFGKNTRVIVDGDNIHQQVLLWDIV